MIRKGKIIGFSFLSAVILFLLAVSLFSFCILTNSSGNYRMYFENINGNTYIPFVYRLHSSTPGNYFTPVWNGANTWNNVQSAYWVFEEGETTSNNHLGQNGINLVYFDFAGDNFEPGTSTIAFSMTYTSYQGGVFHAVESDLIWNARDYPPSPYDYPTNQYDLQSVITHEFGHHFGLGHQGSPGSPPGCGELIEEATMYGYASYYDTTKRSLHPHDIAGVATIYPSWVIAGSVTDSASGNPVSGAYIILNQGRVTSVGPPEYNNTWECPGYIISDTIWVGNDGLFAEVALDQNLSMDCKAFGFESRSADAHFNPPGGIEETDTIFVDFVLPQEPGVSVTGTIKDESTQEGISAEVEFYGLTNPGSYPIAVTSTDTGGYFEVSIPAGPYRIEVNSDPPYPPYYEDLDIGDNGANLTILLSPAELLLYDDDGGENRQNVYIDILDSLGVTYHHWDASEVSVPIEFSVLQQFRQPLTVIWFTALTQNPLSDSELALIDSILSNSGRIFLVGNNIVSSLNGDSFLSERLHAEFVSKVSNQLLKSVTGDPIGQDKYLSVGTLNADKDMIRTDGHPQAAPVFQILGQNDYGMTRFEGDYHLVLGGFVFGDITETQDVFITRFELLQNILNWFDDPNNLPGAFSLIQPMDSQFNWDENPDTVMFNWMPADDPDGDQIEYTFFLSTDSSFKAPYYFSTTTSDTFLTHVFDFSCDEWAALSDDTTLTLYWGVFASDGKGVSIPENLGNILFEDSWEEIPPAGVIAILPSDGDTLFAFVDDSLLNVEFRWTQATDPNCYTQITYRFALLDSATDTLYVTDTPDTSISLNLTEYLGASPLKLRNDTSYVYSSLVWEVFATDGQLSSDTLTNVLNVEWTLVEYNSPPELTELLFPISGDTLQYDADSLIALRWRAAYDPDTADVLLYHLSIQMDSADVVSLSTQDTFYLIPKDTFGLMESEIKRIDWDVYADDSNDYSDTLYSFFYLQRKPTSIMGKDNIPDAFALYNAYPNPFNPSTTISFSIPDYGYTRALIINLKGQLVRTLVNKSLQPGNYSFIWDGTDDQGQSVSSGIYLLSLRWKNEVKNGRLLLIK